MRVIPFLLSLLLVAGCRTLGAAAGLTAGFSQAGLSSLKDGDVELLLDGQPSVEFVLLETKTRDANGLTDAGNYAFERLAAEPAKVTFDAGKKTLRAEYAWGTASYAYLPAPGKLDLAVTLTNTSAKTLADFAIVLGRLKFPVKPGQVNPGRDNLKCSMDNLALLSVPFADRQLLLCNLTMDPPCYLGLGKAADAAQQEYPLKITGGVQAAEVGAYEIPPHGQPRIAPGKSLTLTFTLRSIPAAESVDAALADVYKEFARFYSPMHVWKDRRPIGMIMLPSKGHISDTNPRGWFDDKTLDVTTPEGKEKFRKQMLAFADQSVRALKDTGAQGMIVWDLEGDENPHPITYIGDPRMMKKLDPEMDAVADEFFKKFTDAGLRPGCCIRPTQVYYREDKKAWDHGTGSDCGPGRGSDYEKLKPADLPWWRFFPIVERLSDKITYAQKRWGCTIFYIDTNGIFRPLGEKGDFDWQLVTAAMWRQLQARHPDVLLIPELVSGDKLGYHAANWAFTAAYQELDMNGFGTPASIRTLLPGAFSIVNINDGPIEEKKAVLVDAVRNGDILLFRGWFGDSRNAIVKAIYQEAGVGQ